MVEPREDYGDTDRNEEKTELRNMWTIVQKNKGNTRRKQVPGRGEGGTNENHHAGSRYSVLIEKENTEVDKEDGVRGYTGINTGNGFNYEHSN